MVLIDTCAFLWIDDSDFGKIGAAAWALLNSPDTHVLLSIASVWEMAIKRSRGKLTATTPLEALISGHLTAGQLEILPIKLADLALVEGFPFHHNDPFDRILAAQSLTNGIPILTPDIKFDHYGVIRVWN